MFHKDLEAWKESIKLVKLVYKLTNDFPKQEDYGLTSQIRRAVISIPSNIAEGNARATAKETIRFIDIALGSLAELDTQLTIAQELNYIENYNIEDEQIKKVNALISGLRKNFVEKVNNNK